MWGLFFILFFLCASILPIALFDIGYKSHFVSKELVLLVLVDLFFVYLLMVKQDVSKPSRAHYLIILPISIVCFYNYASPHLLAVCLLYLLLFMLVAPNLQIKNLFLLIAWSAMIATLFSFYQHWAIIYDVVPKWLSLTRELNQMVGVLGQPNLMACLIVTGLFAWLHCLWKKYGQQSWPWICQIPVVIFVWAFLLTGSRAGVLAVSSALLVACFALSRSGSLHTLKPCALRLLVGLVVAIVLFNLTPSGETGFVGARSLALGTSSVGSNGRLIFWGSAASMFLDYPWVGTGLGGFRRLLGSYMTPVAEGLKVPYDGISDTLWAHNDFLQVFAENGLLVGFSLIFFFTWMLWKLRPNQDQSKLFLFCALWSFMVFMLFGHPFNDYVLMFYLVLLVSAAMPSAETAYFSKRLRTPLLIVLAIAVVWVNWGIVTHAINMRDLKHYLKDASNSQPLTVERLVSAREKYSYESLLEEPLAGWEFRYQHLNTLALYAFEHRDAQMAAYLISEFEGFKSEHSSAKLTYQFSRLYYLVGEYTICKETADEAFLLKPDMYHYSNFGHICLAFDISRQKGIPVDQLLGDEVFYELKNKDFFMSNKLDANRIAL